MGTALILRSQGEPTPRHRASEQTFAEDDGLFLVLLMAAITLEQRIRGGTDGNASDEALQCAATIHEDPGVATMSG